MPCFLLQPECSVVTGANSKGRPQHSGPISGLHGGSSFMWVKEGSRCTFSLRRALQSPVRIVQGLAKGTLILALELSDGQGRWC